MDTNALYNRFWSDKEGNEIAADNIEYLLENTYLTLEENELSKLEIPFAVDLAMNKLQAMIDLAMMEYDGKILPQVPFENLDPDGEPYPNTIDSWARGTVATRKVVQDPDALHKKVVPTTTSTPSVSSYRSTATGKSRGTAGTNTRSRLGTSQDKRTGSGGDDKTGQIMELDEGIDGEFNDLNATGFMFDALLKMKKKKSLAYFELEEEMGEFEQLQEQIDKAAKEMRGKKFVLDRYGQPVLLGKVNTETLPKFTVELASSVVDNIPVTSHGHGHGQKQKQNNLPLDGQINNGDNRDRPLSSSRGKGKKFIRVAGSRNIDQDSFQPTLSLATSLSKVESIPKVSAGVAIRNKLSAKVGETIPEDHKHISRQTYLSKTLNNNTSASANNSVSASHSLESKSNSKRNIHSSSSAAKSSDTINLVHSIDYLPDINPLEGSRMIENHYSSYDLSDEELGLGPVNNTSSPSRSIDDMNNYNNKGGVPKVSSKQKESVALLRSNQTHLGVPKDRDLPRNMKKITDRKHLAAPPLGHTTGHGLAATHGTNNALNQGSYMSAGNQSGVSISFDSVSSGSAWHKPESKKY